MSVIVITVAGNDVTANVDFASAKFIGQVNGQVGQFEMRVRDTEHAASFIDGAEVTVDIDGARLWGGYVTRVGRIYAFDYDDTTDADTTPRYWKLQGVDYNVLFNKRVAYKKSSPATTDPFMKYTAGSNDVAVLNDIHTNYFDVQTDGIDLTSGVTHVGDVGDVTFTAGEASDTWGQVVSAVARETGAVFYIDPDGKIFRYLDAEATTSPYILTDGPDPLDPFEIGYRDAVILSDGTKLINDMFAWGLGNGPNGPVFTRVRDTPSIATHGVWQFGHVTSGIYHQTYNDRIANSYVYGSPQSKRGHKDDAVVITTTVFEPVFKLGQIVQFAALTFFTSEIPEPFDDAGANGPIVISLPIRRMEITFPTPTDAMFKLTLTYEIDLPWSFFESYLKLPKVEPPIIDIRISRPVMFEDFEDRTICTDSTFAGWGTAHTGLSPSGPRVWTSEPES